MWYFVWICYHDLHRGLCLTSVYCALGSIRRRVPDNFIKGTQYHNIPTFSGNIKSTDARFLFVSKAHINILYMPTMYMYCLYVEFLNNAIYCLFDYILFINESHWYWHTKLCEFSSQQFCPQFIGSGILHPLYIDNIVFLSEKINGNKNLSFM
jgi:hypothetical protein